MNLIKEKINIFYAIIIYFTLIGCASSPPLPPYVEITPIAKDVSSELGGFLGVWEGKWGGTQLDSIIIIESIDNEKAEVTFSYGGYEQGYINFAGKVLQGPRIEWEMDKLLEMFKNDEMKDFKCPCIMSLKLRNDADKLIGFFEFPTYGVKLRGDFSRKVIK